MQQTGQTCQSCKPYTYIDHVQTHYSSEERETVLVSSLSTLFRPRFATHALVLGRVCALLPLLLRARPAVVYAKLPSVDDLLGEDFPGLGGTSNVDEVGMGKPSWLARSPVNGNTH